MHRPVDECSVFSRDEHMAALRMIMAADEAERLADDLFDSDHCDLAEAHSYLGDDHLNLLSLVSTDCAERVRALREESPDEATARVSAFRQRTGL